MKPVVGTGADEYHLLRPFFQRISVLSNDFFSQLFPGAWVGAAEPWRVRGSEGVGVHPQFTQLHRPPGFSPHPRPGKKLAKKVIAEEGNSLKKKRSSSVVFVSSSTYYSWSGGTSAPVKIKEGVFEETERERERELRDVSWIACRCERGGQIARGKNSRNLYKTNCGECGARKTRRISKKESRQSEARGHRGLLKGEVSPPTKERAPLVINGEKFRGTIYGGAKRTKVD